jgi:hypothetical protein
MVLEKCRGPLGGGGILIGIREDFLEVEDQDLGEFFC